MATQKNDEELFTELTQMSYGRNLRGAHGDLEMLRRSIVAGNATLPGRTHEESVELVNRAVRWVEHAHLVLNTDDNRQAAKVMLKVFGLFALVVLTFWLLTLMPMMRGTAN